MDVRSLWSEASAVAAMLIFYALKIASLRKIPTGSSDHDIIEHHAILARGAAPRGVPTFEVFWRCQPARSAAHSHFLLTAAAGTPGRQVVHRWNRNLSGLSIAPLFRRGFSLAPAARAESPLRCRLRSIRALHALAGH